MAGRGGKQSTACDARQKLLAGRFWEVFDWPAHLLSNGALRFRCGDFWMSDSSGLGPVPLRPTEPRELAPGLEGRPAGRSVRGQYLQRGGRFSTAVSTNCLEALLKGCQNDGPTWAKRKWRWQTTAGSPTSLPCVGQTHVTRPVGALQCPSLFAKDPFKPLGCGWFLKSAG